MKISKAAQLAVIGIILNILSVVLRSFTTFDKIFLISNSMRIAGSVLLVIFFYVFIIKQQETSSLRTAGVLGLIGYLITVILNVSGLIFNSVYNIAEKDTLKYIGLLNIASMFSRINFIMGLIPIVLIIACFMVFYRNLFEKSSFKKVALYALIGQFILLIDWMIEFVLNMFLFKVLYQLVSIRGLIIISNIVSVIEIIALMLSAIFFISIYKLLNNNEDMQQMAYM